MNLSKLQADIDALQEFIKSNGWLIVDKKVIQSGYQLIVTDEITKVSVAFFYSGKFSFKAKQVSCRPNLNHGGMEEKPHQHSQQHRQLLNQHSLKHLQVPPQQTLLADQELGWMSPVKEIILAPW